MYIKDIMIYVVYTYDMLYMSYIDGNVLKWHTKNIMSDSANHKLY